MDHSLQKMGAHTSGDRPSGLIVAQVQRPLIDDEGDVLPYDDHDHADIRRAQGRLVERHIVCFASKTRYCRSQPYIHRAKLQRDECEASGQMISLIV